MDIRDASAADAVAISQLISGLSHHFTLDPEGRGAEAFFEHITPSAIRAYIESPDCAYYVGEIDQAIAGIVAMRDGNHLLHLFIEPSLQGRGLARTLWQHALLEAKQRSAPTHITVFSSPNAVAVYERFGFRASGPREEKNGIAFIPMRLDL